MNSFDIVILYSGGLDSKVMELLAQETGKTYKKVYFNIGHDYAWKEIEALEDDVDVIDVSWLDSQGQGKDGNGMASIFIPGRNMLLATLAACKYMPNEIWLGALLGEIHKDATDKNNEFAFRFNRALTYAMSPFKEVKLVYPFVERGMDKFDVTKYALDKGHKELILGSSSCMSAEVGNCGRCGVCLRRAGIFAQLGISEKYNVNPWLAPENQKLIGDLVEADRNNDDSHYDWHRRREIVPALNIIFNEAMEYLEKYAV